MGDRDRRDEPIDVLMVEDNPGDARLAREAFSAVDSRIDLTVVEDGTEAISRLRAGDAGSTPALVLLDLDLPGADGRTVLRECKTHPTLRRTPVVVFTSSDDPQDVRELYANHANAYLPKPRDSDGFFDTIRRLDDFWFSTALLPEAVRP